MESYPPKPSTKRLLWGVLLGAILLMLLAGGAVWYFVAVPHRSPTNLVAGASAGGAAGGSSPPAAEVSAGSSAADIPATGPKGMTRALADAIGPSPITVAPVSPEQAASDFEKGMQLYGQQADPIETRTLLNRAYSFGRLPEPRASEARKALEDLAHRTVLRRDGHVNPRDPYLISYTFRAGDLLNSRRQGGRVTHPGVIARHSLNVPDGVIVWVNGLRSSADFRAGVSYKLLKGPFHLVVYKSQRAADIYLQDLFVRRISVCIGAPDTPTPEGYFRIVNGGKTLHSPYYPPAETGQSHAPIYPGQPGYPLGPDGRNMKIEGIVQLGTNITAGQSYAIHGTNDPASIGRAASRGCIRLRNEDMLFLYGALQDYAAPDDPRATWKRWSTITILP